MVAITTIIGVLEEGGKGRLREEGGGREEGGRSLSLLFPPLQRVTTVDGHQNQ